MRVSTTETRLGLSGKSHSCRRTCPISVPLEWAQRPLLGTRSCRCQGLWLRAESREDLRYISRDRPAVAGRRRSLCGGRAFVWGSRWAAAAGPDAGSHGEGDAEPARERALRAETRAVPGLDRPGLGMSRGRGHTCPQPGHHPGLLASGMEDPGRARAVDCRSRHSKRSWAECQCCRGRSSQTSSVSLL